MKAPGLQIESLNGNTVAVWLIGLRFAVSIVEFLVKYLLGWDTIMDVISK